MGIVVFAVKLRNLLRSSWSRYFAIYYVAHSSLLCKYYKYYKNLTATYHRALFFSSSAQKIDLLFN